MIPEYRRDFNARFSEEKYANFLAELQRRCGVPVKFRCNETPCFLPKELIDRMVAAGEDLIGQLVHNESYLKAASALIPTEYRVPAPSDRPLFIQADFGIVREEQGGWAPRLVEIQGFPSLYAFQLTLAQTYKDVYGLDPELRTMLDGLDEQAYGSLLKQAILRGHDPAEVVLLEADPLEQKTLPDFLETQRHVGIPTVDISTVWSENGKLYYSDGSRQIRIRRIYNRAIADELIRKKTPMAFRFSDDLDVEWAGNPNWYFLISKFSLPCLRHETVPRTWFLSDLTELPLDPERLVLKPLFSFAGLGVIVGPTKEDIAAVPDLQRKDYILQERMDFAGVIETPSGPDKAEVRIMYIWADRLRAVNTIVRTGRGKMMGVDHNRNLDWVGASAAFFPSRAC